MAAAAGAAADVAIILQHQAMSDYLLNTLEVNNQGLRARLLRARIWDHDRLVTKKTGHIHTMCMRIIKSTGLMATRNITADMEEDLEAHYYWCRYNYMIQRPVVLANATRANIVAVYNWINLLPEDPDASTVDKFTDGGKKRVWFESIINYLGVKKGPSGFPLRYVIRERAALPIVDPGFGLPEFYIELETRGRHGGHYYAADNQVVWLFLRGLCHGTAAWTLISSFEARNNGRGAYLALLAQYMGSDVRQVLLRAAEKFLENARFDNENRNFTFDKFIGLMRQAFEDLGPDDQMSEQRKVTKLMQAWQVAALKHLDAMVTGDPVRRNNFEAAVTFLQDQLTVLKTKNTSRGTRRIGAFQKSSQQGGHNNKSPHKKWTRTKHPNSKSKFDPSNPGKYLPGGEWSKLLPHQQVAARKAREEQGIPTRQVKAVTTAAVAAAKADSDSEMESVESQPSVPTSTMRLLSMTQRHDGKPKAKGNKKAKKGGKGQK